MSDNQLTEGMFLCAGLSTRMLPLTKHIPKVLLPFGSKNIFQWMMAYFEKQGVERLAVNTHHGAQFIDAFLEINQFEPEIHTFYEEEILGTGGAIKNMQVFVSQDHFFVINCDVFTETILQDMFAFHLSKNALATLLIAPNPHDKYTKIFVDPKTHTIPSILSPDPKNQYAGMFAGVTILSKEIFGSMPLENKFCFVRGLLEPLCLQGAPVYGYVQDIAWHDTGEVQLYEKALKELQQNPLPWMK